MDAVLFAAGLATMYGAHQVADHVFGNTDRIAENKGKPGRVGWSAILEHVGLYHLIMYFMLTVTFITLDLNPSLLGFSLAMLFSMVTHAILDRRWPVKWILEKTGSPKFAEMLTPLWGVYAADQSLHYACLWISALLLTVG